MAFLMHRMLTASQKHRMLTASQKHHKLMVSHLNHKHCHKQNLRSSPSSLKISSST